MRATALVTGLVLAGLLGFWTGTASAVSPTRTWVTGVGDDMNDCSRTAPCKTWAGALAKTAAGGEIDALEPGGFGSVTITTAITLDGGPGVASVLAQGTDGIIISAGATDVVTLRNLSLNGASGTGTGGLDGIHFLSGAALHVEHCVIMNFTQSGIEFAPSGASRLTAVDTIATNNAVNGIKVDPQSGGSAKVLLARVTLSSNGGGFRVDTTASGAGAINATVMESETFGNINSGVNAVSGATGAIVVILNRVASVNNGSFGIQSNQLGANTSVFVGFSTITGNNIAGNPLGGGTIASYGNNEINGNTNNGTFSTIAPE